MTKNDIPNSLRTAAQAVYNGSTYTINGFRLWFNKRDKKLEYSAELLDKNGNSIVHAPIEKVELVDS